MGFFRKRLPLIGIGGFLVIVVVLQLLPFYVAITTSLKPISDLSSQWLLPRNGIYLQNFVTAIEQGGILRAIFSSAVITAISTVLCVVVGALAAYPLARRLTRVNTVLMMVILGTLMIPPLSILVPLYTMMSQLKGVNTYWGIILVLTAFQLPLAIFLYASFIRTIPSSLEEAARVDGANIFQIFFHIVLPLLKPVTATVVILVSVHFWNEYQLSLYMLTSPEVRTIAPSIGAFFSENNSNLGAAAAASLLGALPIVVVYVFLQKYFIKGMVAGAEK